MLKWPRHTQGSKTQHTYSLEDNSRIVNINTHHKHTPQTLDKNTTMHHKQYPAYLHTIRPQRQPLYKQSTIQHKQHHRNRLQPNQTTRTHNNRNTPAEIIGKTFDTVNTLAHKLHETNIPHTIFYKFIANYIK